MTIYLKPSEFIRKKRIITRYINQKIRLEDCLYTPSLKILIFMFRDIKNHETGKDDLEIRLNQCIHKTLKLKSNKKIKKFILNLQI